MELQITDTSETRKEALVQLSPEDIETSRSKIIREFCQHARLPGFRPGKAPQKLVLQKFAKQIKEELASELLRNAFQKLDKDGGLEILNIINMEQPDPEAAEPALRVTVDVKPAFNLPQYEGVAVQKERVVVSDKEIDDAIEYIRQQRADYNPVERAAADGDVVRISYEGKIGEQSVAELAPERVYMGIMQNTWETIGEQDGYGVPGMAQALAGKSAGDKTTVDITFPADFREEPLREKTATYSVEVHEVRERVLPEVTEEFAKSMKADSIEALRESIRGDLARQKEVDASNRMRTQITESLITGTSFPVPESLLEEETRGMLTNFMRTNLQRGASPEDFEQQKEALYASASEAAERNVRLQLILDAIAREKKIELSEDDLANYVYELASRTRRSPEDLVGELKKDRKRLSVVQSDARRRKVVDFLAEKATVTEVDPPEPQA